jgi:hypothetical protein
MKLHNDIGVIVDCGNDSEILHWTFLRKIVSVHGYSAYNHSNWNSTCL